MPELEAAWEEMQHQQPEVREEQPVHVDQRSMRHHHLMRPIWTWFVAHEKPSSTCVMQIQ
jgi:hypothetical protein